MGKLLVLLVVVGLVVHTLSQGRERAQALQGSRAAAMSFHERLGSDVATLDPGADPVIRRALAGSACRWARTCPRWTPRPGRASRTAAPAADRGRHAWS